MFYLSGKAGILCGSQPKFFKRSLQVALKEISKTASCFIAALFKNVVVCWNFLFQRNSSSNYSQLVSKDLNIDLKKRRKTTTLSGKTGKLPSGLVVCKIGQIWTNHIIFGTFITTPMYYFERITGLIESGKRAINTQ